MVHALTAITHFPVGGVSVQQLINYFRTNEAYHFCLSEFRTVSPQHRQFFAVFEENDSLELIEDHLTSQEMREFLV